MKKILLINTGGTFNKRYDPVKGTLDVVRDDSILQALLGKWQCDLEIINIIGKDSLEMTTQDRMELLALISMNEHDDIVVIHGTDTMDVTAEYLADAEMEKRIVLTGAMVPYSIDPTDASCNLASALGYLQLQDNEGVFGSYDKVKKNREEGRFTLR